MELIKELTSINVSHYDNFDYKNILKLKNNKDNLEARIYSIPNNDFIYSESQEYLAKDATDNIINIEFKNEYNDIIKNFKKMISKEFNDLARKNLIHYVGINGFKNEEYENNGEKGSIRYSVKNKDLAEFLTNIINQVNLKELVFHKDKYGEYVYEFVNVSQYFRFMKYTENSTHYPHYDSDFVCSYDKNEEYITLYTMVLYLTKNSTGEIAFIDETKKNDSIENAILRKDWIRQANEDEIFLKLRPNLNLVLFPHKLCHSVLPFIPKQHEDKERIIIRGDLIFKKLKQL